MTTSTLQKLKRYKQKVTGELPSWADPNWHHPLPTFPDQEYLEDEYLKETERANPWLLEETRELVEEVGRLRREKEL